MYNQGLIDCISYSLWLNRFDAPSGQLLFGAVDTDKFYGTLETTPISMTDLRYGSTAITLSGIQVSSGQTNVTIYDEPFQITVDSSGNVIALPPNMTDKIFAQIGPVQYIGPNSFPLIACSMGNSDTTLDFVFGSITISVPMDELIGQYNVTTCYISIYPTNNSDSWNLGSPFFHSAYVVYDFVSASLP